MTKAKLGLESAFYFDEKTQSWVDGSAPASGTASGAAEIGARPVMQPPNATMAAASLDGDAPSASASREGPPTGGGAGPTHAGTRARYVDVFAREGMTSAPVAAPMANVSAFVPSVAPIGGTGAPIPHGGMQFFVPAPRAADEGGDDESESLREPLALMQPTVSDASAVEEDRAPVLHDVDVGGTSVSDAPAPVVDAGDREAEGADFGGGASDWAEAADGSPRWAEADVPPVESDQQHPQWETQTQEWLQHEDASMGAAEVAQWDTNAPSTTEWTETEIVASETYEAQQGDERGDWEGYEGHDDYDYDPRWKYDENTGEWYWDGGDDENWVERATHDAAIAELQAAIDARASELEDIKLNRDALTEELAHAHATTNELSTKVQDLEAKLAERSTSLDSAVDASEESLSAAFERGFERGKEEGYTEGYAAGSAEAQEELADLLVCLGQEGRRVEKLREMLAETGADIDAIIAEFEADEEEQIANLIDGQIQHDEFSAPEDVSIDAIAEQDLSNLPEISQSMKAMAAEIDTPERLRDFGAASNLNPSAEEFILPTPPKAKGQERNLANAFEVA